MSVLILTRYEPDLLTFVNNEKARFENQNGLLIFLKKI